jgi:cellulose synthase/poly-beta-1,6-N-acetylglucosamine synthase-like glycosyltransferase
LELLFWICLVAIAYPYVIYPLLLMAGNRLAGRRMPVPEPGHQPTVSIILPVHNEARRIPEKVRNLLALDYPAEKVQIVVVGDGCTDDSLERAKEAGAGRVEVVSLDQRAGKANALNAGLACVRHEIVVFTDAAIMLEPGALAALTAHFANAEIGCVSGEDHVEGGGNEGLYGELELLMRREEARLHSIAGASGCFYAERRALCKPFVAGMAPDFLSVLNVVRAGYRASCEPRARGSMTATPNQRAEFTRKARTFLRGLTALFGNAALLNPLRFPGFAFILWSHKLARWLGPVAMAGCLLSAAALSADPFYRWLFGLQLLAYAVAIAGLLWPALAERMSLVRIPAFFLLVNLAAAKALLLWLGGVRQEVWEPTRRPA